MTQVNRRRFLQLTGGTAAASLLSESIARAASLPANRRTGTIQDVEHVVVLMQENRSFDHYFGTLNGVRGYGDPRPVTLPNGQPVFAQPDGAGNSLLPFHPEVADLGTKFIDGLDHSWNGGHQAFNHGDYDQWLPAKGPGTMGYFTRTDIPFHFALADAFTVCDAYHCSLMTSTDPNRYYMFTGYTGNDGVGGGPVVTNAEAGYDWKTYPERLEAAGVSWKVYQDIGTGLNAKGSWGWTDDAYIGNYGDTSLLYFHQYQNAQPGTPLYDKARTGTNAQAGQGYFDVLKADIAAGKLPQVSYIVAPEAFSEHPNWPVNYGAWYIAQVLDALTADPAVWAKTALFITYDENDGFFDHVVPAFPPETPAQGASTTDVSGELFTPKAGENYTAGAYGLGVRVPMLVVSPWSKGGWVNSQVSDHTSIIQFMETRFGVKEPNISPWRRAVCGDLTSAFNFGKSDPVIPALPSTAAYVPADKLRHSSYPITLPTSVLMPKQEKGRRPANALPYELSVDSLVGADGKLHLTFASSGKVGANFYVTSQLDKTGPWSYTVGAGLNIAGAWNLPAADKGAYDYTVHAPNGFYRQFKGSVGASLPEVSATHKPGTQSLVLSFTNTGSVVAALTITDAYGVQGPVVHHARPGQTVTHPVNARPNHGWYDVTVTSDQDAGWIRRLAGHVEDGHPSASDPAIITV